MIDGWATAAWLVNRQRRRETGSLCICERLATRHRSGLALVVHEGCIRAATTERDGDVEVRYRFDDGKPARRSYQFQSRQSGNPADRLKGARNRLGEASLDDLRSRETDGKAFLRETRAEKPMDVGLHHRPLEAASRASPATSALANTHQSHAR
jgi:hypothetical protein